MAAVEVAAAEHAARAVGERAQVLQRKSKQRKAPKSSANNDDDDDNRLLEAAQWTATQPVRSATHFKTLFIVIGLAVLVFTEWWYLSSPTEKENVMSRDHKQKPLVQEQFEPDEGDFDFYSHGMEKDKIAELLFPFVNAYSPMFADEVVDLLSELDYEELMVLVQSPEAFISRVDEALTVLKNGLPGMTKLSQKNDKVHNKGSKKGDIQVSKKSQKREDEFVKAAIEEDFDTIQRILKQGIDKPISRSHTPLYVATALERLSVVKYLLEQGATLDKADDVGNTPLAIAATRGFHAVTRYLLEQGADVNKADNSGYSPLHSAVHSGDREMALLLMSYGADLEAKTIIDDLPIDMTDDEKLKQILRDEPKRRKDHGIKRAADYYNQQLSKASKNGDLKKAQYCVANGADKDKGDTLGRFPLFWASLYGNLDLVQYLVEIGATLDKATNLGITPLIASATSGHLEICRYLLEQGADKDKADDEDWTPLHWATSQDRLEVAMLLMSYGADLNARSKNSNHLPIDVVGIEEMRQAIRNESKRRIAALQKKSK